MLCCYCYCAVLKVLVYTSSQSCCYYYNYYLLLYHHHDNCIRSQFTQRVPGRISKPQGPPCKGHVTRVSDADTNTHTYAYIQIEFVYRNSMYLFVYTNIHICSVVSRWHIQKLYTHTQLHIYKHYRNTRTHHTNARLSLSSVN